MTLGHNAIARLIEQAERNFYAVRAATDNVDAVKLLQVRINALGYALTRTPEQLLAEIEEHTARLKHDLRIGTPRDLDVTTETISALREAYGLKKAFG